MLIQFTLCTYMNLFYPDIKIESSRGLKFHSCLHCQNFDISVKVTEGVPVPSEYQWKGQD